jgi:hypothetical protein
MRQCSYPQYDGTAPLSDADLLELALWFELRYGRTAPIALPAHLEYIYHETVADGDLI